MDYHHRVLLKNSYPDWTIKEPEKNSLTPFIHPDTGLEVKKMLASLCSMFQVSLEIQKNLLTYQHTSYLQGVNTLKSVFMYPKDKIPSQLKQNIHTKHTNAPA